MHELGVVFYVVKDVKKVAEKNHVEVEHGRMLNALDMNEARKVSLCCRKVRMIVLLAD